MHPQSAGGTVGCRTEVMCRVASIQGLHNEQWLMVTVVKQMLSTRARPEWHLFFLFSRSLSHSVLHQYTQLHINLTLEQPLKVPAVSYTFTFELNAQSILRIMHLDNLIFAEA